LRIKILQVLCFERIGTVPNDRLLISMDKLIVSGKASARLNVGRGATLRCRYGEAVIALSEKREKTDTGDRRSMRAEKRKGRQDRMGKAKGQTTREMTFEQEPVVRMEGPGMYRWNAGGPDDAVIPSLSSHAFLWKEQGRIVQARIRRQAEGGRWAAFDAEKVPFPLSVRGIKAGDRIRPFGLDADKKVKEILIDRKVPREERWGRAVVCDAEGKLLWIPGVVRSAHAPVTQKTRRTVVLRAEIPGKSPRRKDGLHRGSSMLN
jgi:tRNA(Ile)-lysidine synthetase-like protein